MLNEADIVERFRRAMAEKGIETDDVIQADGDLHRIHVSGDRKGSRNGWYVLHLDGRASGAFGCNKKFGHTQKFTWTAERDATPLTPEQRRAWAREMAEKKARRQAEKRARADAAAARAQAIWDAAKECTEHPYLTRKHVQSHGLRVGTWEIIDKDSGEVRVISKNALLVPIRDTRKRIHALQAIFPRKALGGRDKDFLADGEQAGHFYTIGKPVQVERDGRLVQVIIICEGYATGATLHEVTGHAVVVAFSAGNLLPVARVLRDRLPDAVLVFAADNDLWTLKPVENPGVHYAREAAHQVRGLLAVPPFSQADADGTNSRREPTGPTDFNDLWTLRGHEEVLRVIEETLDPPAAAPAAPLPSEPPPWEGSTDLPPVAPPVPETVARVVADATAAAERGKSAVPPPPTDGDDRPENNKHFAILGYDRGVVYIFQHHRKQIIEVTKGDLGDVGLIELAHLNWWELNFPGDRGNIDRKAAAEFIFRVAEKRGIYDPDRLRGRGAWIDQGRIVYHHGGYLTVDGVETDITAIRSNYVYELARNLPPPSIDEMDSEEGERLLELAKRFRWELDGSAVLLAGWVALAPVCGAMKWRPHIWITGGAGSGKSTVLERYVHHLLDGLEIYAQGASSEAGIRQNLRSDARPVLFDESEQNTEKESSRVQAVLALIRQASTESQAQTLRGTAGGTAMNFHIRSMFCLGSIQVGMKHQADIDRLTVLGLRSKGSDGANEAEGWQILDGELRKMQADPGLPGRLFRRALNQLPITLKNIAVFTSVAARKFGNQRDGDQYGTLLAGAWSLIATVVATEEQAAEMLDAYDWSSHREDGEVDDSQRALAALLEAHIRVTGGITFTVYELAARAYGASVTTIGEMTPAVAGGYLERHGIRVYGEHLLLSNTSQELRRMMHGTPFEADLRGLLLRIPGAEKYHKPMRFSGSQARCIALPLAPIVGEKIKEGSPL